MNEPSRGNGRKSLLLIAAIAFVPMLVAYGVFFFAPEIIPQTTTNRGELVSPPKDVSEHVPTSDGWRLITLVQSSCDAACAELIYQVRQIHIALGKNSDRVSRTLVTPSPLDSIKSAELQVAYPNLEIRTDPQLARLLPASKAGANPNGFVVYVVDPLGQVVMAYDTERVGKPLLLDLKHLLKVSSIG